jgi:hypothetical protein
MTPTAEPNPELSPTRGTDLAAAIHRVLAASTEPLTPAKIRAQLPAPLRNVGPEEFAECLQRQVAADVLHQFPKYRSQQDRYWDRSMPIHVAALLRATLQTQPLAWSDLRRKLPAYAQVHADSVLQEQVVQGLLYRHPPSGKRGSERFGTQQADPKEYLRSALSKVFHDLGQLGFSQPQLRHGAIELLHEEEWAAAPAQAPSAAADEPAQDVAPSPGKTDRTPTPQPTLRTDAPEALAAPRTVPSAIPGQEKSPVAEHQPT